VSKPLSHSMPTVTFHLFKNTFGANDPSSTSGFRFVLLDIVNMFCLSQNVASISDIICIIFTYCISSGSDCDDNGDD